MSDYLDQLRQPGQRVNPLFAFLGIEVVAIEADRAVLRLPARPEHLQGAGAIAGGVISTLLDEAMAHALIPSMGEGRRLATIELSVRFLKAVRAGDALLAEARVVRAGRTVAFVEAIARNAAGETVARADASFVTA